MLTVDRLRESALLADLPAATLDDLLQCAHALQYRAGQQILGEGDAAPGLLIVQRGRVRLARTAPDGREQVLAMLAAGDHFSAEPLFGDGVSPVTARAMSAVELALFPRDQFLALIARHPDLALATLRALAGQVRELVALVEDLAFRSVRARLARLLLAEAADGTAEFTQQELAERTATVREIAGRALRRLAEEGFVRLARGRVSVLDRAGLAAVVEE
jgi:CRP/FNR family transcriptional regulator, cyclic AMP receptor protein